jgi:hypothetical protein
MLSTKKKRKKAKREKSHAVPQWRVATVQLSFPKISWINCGVYTCAVCQLQMMVKEQN